MITFFNSSGSVAFPGNREVYSGDKIDENNNNMDSFSVPQRAWILQVSATVQGM